MIFGSIAAAIRTTFSVTMPSYTLILALLVARESLADRYHAYHQDHGYHVSLAVYNSELPVVTTDAPSLTSTLASLTTTTASTTSSHSSQPTFWIRDAAGQSEIQLGNMDTGNPQLATSFWTTNSDFVGEWPVLFTLNEVGNLIFVGPDRALLGRVAYSNGYWFIFLDPESHEAQSPFFELCACSIDLGTSQLSCDCGGITEDCHAIETDEGVYCRLWYAYPYPPSTSATTSTTASGLADIPRRSTTSIHAAQPTFAIRDRGGGSQLDLSPLSDLVDEEDYDFARFFPLDKSHNLTFTVTGQGELVHTTPGFSNGELAYSDQYDNLVFAHPDNPPFHGHECTCSVDVDLYDVKCDCGGLIYFCNPDDPQFWAGAPEIKVCSGAGNGSSWSALYAVPIFY